MQRVKFSNYEVDQEIPSLTVGPISQMDLVRYAGASGDFNPIHNDPAFARSVGLDGTIVHGMYVMAQLGRLWSDWVHPSQVKSFGAKFKGITKPGESLHCTGKVRKKKEENGEQLLILELEARSESGEVKATAELVVRAD